MSEAKSEVISVQMEDGRTVNFTGKVRVIKTSIIDDTQAIVRFDFRNGQVRVFDLRNPDIDLIRLAAHGVESKIGDSYAGVQELDDCVEAVEDLTARLYRREWTATRATGESYAGASVLARAVAEVKGKAISVVKDWLRTKSHKEKSALRNSETIRPIVERLEAEKRAKKGEEAAVDLSGALDELDGL